MNDSEDWQRLIRGLRDGNREVLLDFWKQYGDALHKVAEKHLAPGVRRRVGPEDVVQSACRTFLRRAQIGQFQLADSEDLWRLLCVITLTKVREQTRFHLRQKRGLAQEVHAAPTSDSVSQCDPAARGPTPAQAAEFADQLQQILGMLDEEERKIIDLKLQDYTQEEIAQQIQCSERTVRRILKRVQTRLLRDIDM